MAPDLGMNATRVAAAFLLGAAITAGVGVLTWRQVSVETGGGADGSLMAARTVMQLQDWHGRPVDVRIEDAARLASAGRGGAWVVLLLLDDSALYRPDLLEWRYGEKGRAGSRTQPTTTPWYPEAAEAALIAVLLENIPAEAGPAVLWAVTTRLTDTRVGEYSYREGVIRVEKGTARTARIADTAREALRRALGKDLGYDVAAWRKAIVDDKMRTGAGSSLDN